MHVLNILTFLTLSSYTVSGYRILTVCSMPTRSHYNLCRGVVNVLVDRGHELTLISAYHDETAKFRDFTIKGLLENKEKETYPSFDVLKHSKFEMLKLFLNIQSNIAYYMFNDKIIQNMLRDKSEYFDLVIFEYFSNDMMAGFGIKYNCPIIVLSPVSPMGSLVGMFNTPLSIATMPNTFTSFSIVMTMEERVINTLMTIMMEVMNWLFMVPTQKSLYEQYFFEESKSVPFDELKNHLSGMLINSHPSIGVPRPLLPNAIEIAGYHINDPEPLPQDLKKILDDAKNGVIYFSMGSNLRSKDMSQETKTILLEGFKGLKETVLWKYEEDLPDKPKNLIIRNWMPQTGILNHPNTKLFISHGGQLSCTEASHFGVPLMAIPIYGDQYLNSDALQRRGQGIVLDFKNITRESFHWALKEILGNNKYTEKAKEVFQLYHDRPLKPRDALVFHVEHIIRTKGAKHLSPPPLSRCFYILQDVIDVILILLGVVFTLFTILLCNCCCRFRQGKLCKKPKLNEKQKIQ